jgi:cation transport ATPase
MEKIINLENLDCANCATKMENAIKKIEGVNNINISFMTQKMKLDIEEEKYDTIISEIKKVCKKIEPDCNLKEK